MAHYRIFQKTPLTESHRSRVLDLLTPIVGKRPRLVGEEAVGGEWAPVTRLLLDTTVVDDCSSVIVKTVRLDAGEWGTVELLHREQVALSILADVGVAPTLLATDDTEELIVMSDAGGLTVESLLLDGSPDAATAAVVGLGDTLGRLHVATVDREGEHLHALAAAGSPRPAGERYGTWTGVQGWGDIETAATDLGLPSPAKAAADVAHVRRCLANPGPFLALTHTDPSPPNALVTPCGIVLVDFEGSGFRHIGLDLAWLLFPFPNYSAHYGVLPEEVVHAAEVAYRRRLAAVVPEAGSDRQYDEMVAVGLAAALIVRTHRLRLLASEGQGVFDSWRRRTQLLQQIGVFVDRCEKSAELPQLVGWFKRLAVAMADRWPDAGCPEPPLFPAFSAGAPTSLRSRPPSDAR